MNAIEVHSLTKVYRPPLFSSSAPVAALRGVTLQVERGTLYTLLGPNGAGKTTLLRILAGLITPCSGEATVHGTPVRDRAALAKKIGFLDTEYLGHVGLMTGRENLEFFATLLKMPEGMVRKRIEELTKLFGIDSLLDRKTQTYSRGMLQRLLLIRALLHDPEVVLLDEPNSHLDPRAAREFHSLLRDTLVKDLGRTVLLTTHQLEEARQTSDTVGFFCEGKLVREIPGESIRELGDDLLRVYLETMNCAGEKTVSFL